MCVCVCFDTMMTTMATTATRKMTTCFACVASESMSINGNLCKCDQLIQINAPIHLSAGLFVRAKKNALKFIAID